MGCIWDSRRGLLIRVKCHVLQYGLGLYGVLHKDAHLEIQRLGLTVDLQHETDGVRPNHSTRRTTALQMTAPGRARDECRWYS